MNSAPLTALSPLDGRYHSKVSALQALFQRIWTDSIPRPYRNRMAQGVEPDAPGIRGHAAILRFRNRSAC